jgi:hypothetical protein
LPEYPVFIDGRTDLYDDDLINQWLRVMRGEAGWQEVLESWQVQLVLVEVGTPVAGRMEEQGWVKLYEDSMAVVYGR